MAARPRAGHPRRAGGLRRRLDLDRLRRRQPGRGPGRARRARAPRRPAGSGTAAARVAADRARRWTRPTDAANAAVLAAHRRRLARNPASCTFVAAVVDGEPAGGRLGRRQPRLLAARTQGERAAAHRRRLLRRGADRRRACPGTRPRTARRPTPSPAGSGSTPPTTPRGRPPCELDAAGLAAGLLRRPVELLLRSRPTSRRWSGRLRTRPGRSRSALAGALVDWANAQGGHDNITVALARIDPA